MILKVSLLERMEDGALIKRAGECITETNSQSELDYQCLISPGTIVPRRLVDVIIRSHTLVYIEFMWSDTCEPLSWFLFLTLAPNPTILARRIQFLS